MKITTKDISRLSLLTIIMTTGMAIGIIMREFIDGETSMGIWVSIQFVFTLVYCVITTDKKIRL
jgi:hypothetical protein